MPKYEIIDIGKEDAYYRYADDLKGCIIEGPCLVDDDCFFSGKFNVVTTCPACMDDPLNHYAFHFIVKPMRTRKKKAVTA